MLLQILQHPKWALAALELRGKLQFKNMERYAPKNSTQSVSNFIAGQLHGSLSWEYLAEIRKHWKGRLVLKGVLRPSDALRAIDSGVDSIIVSNHGGRQTLPLFLFYHLYVKPLALIFQLFLIAAFALASTY
jgi:L-lactate dehydrogenase (cytochrome)